MIVDELARERIRESIHLPNLALSSANPSDASMKWWHHAVVYQVYLKSFADANGDGVGDVAGLIGRLEYLKELGVDALWISPWFVSPMVDGGYDVQDYFNIDPLFGSLDDAQTLIDQCHELGLRVILDMVANHCSDQHPWFQTALAAPANSKERDWFYFKDGQGAGGNEPPNDWKSIFGGPAWTQTLNADGSGGQWYLNLFDSSQPDLNWKNDEVLAQFDTILRYWFDRGVDGLRLDAVAAIGKDDDYRDMGFAPGDLYRPDIWGPVPFFDADGVHGVLRRWRAIAREYPSEKFLVGEVPVRDVDRLANYLRSDELHSTLSFEMSKIGWSARAFRNMADTLHGATFQDHSWKTWTLSSHDEKRTVTRYSSGDDAGGESTFDVTLGDQRARAAYLLALALPGSACIYQGEELGLSEVLDIPTDLLQDPVYFRTGQQALGRDGCRVPLPWDSDGSTFGFSSHHESWLPQPKSWSDISIAQQRVDESSTLRFFQSVLKLRSTAFDTNEWDITWELAPEGVLILRRGPHFRCVVNFSGAPWLLGDDDSVLVSSSPLGGRREIGRNNGAWLRSKD
ncbi:MAG TPA: alpha-amylase family glycosyl hydrolase [Acidimicrobiales bacterium]